MHQIQSRLLRKLPPNLTPQAKLPRHRMRKVNRTFRSNMPPILKLTCPKRRVIRQCLKSAVSREPSMISDRDVFVPDGGWLLPYALAAVGEDRQGDVAFAEASDDNHGAAFRVDGAVITEGVVTFLIRVDGVISYQFSLEDVFLMKRGVDYGADWAILLIEY